MKLNIIVCLTLVASVYESAPLKADQLFTQNIAFNAIKKNPYGEGDAWSIGETYNIFDKSFRADLPPYSADPTKIALNAFADLFDISIPSLFDAQLGGYVGGSAKLDFGYFATAGQLDISFPASAHLNFETTSTGNSDYVTTTQSYQISANYVPGVQRILPINLAGIAGAGYIQDPLQGVSFTNYSMPSFSTTSPNASAWLNLRGDVSAGLYAKVTALGGLIDERQDFGFSETFGGELVKINPTGLFVGGDLVAGIDPNQPIGPIPLGELAELEIRIPNIAQSSAPLAAGSATLTAYKSENVLKLKGNLEKVIPFIGPLLEKQIGGFKYNLLEIDGGPTVGVYQDLSFTANPELQLKFSEPVMVRNANGEFELSVVAQAPVNLSGLPLAPIEWLPIFSNSTEIKIEPTYIMNNTFSTETGLSFGLEIGISALEIETPFPAPADKLGPAFEKTYPIPILDVALIPRTTFSVDIPNITALPITIEKRNIPLTQGAIGDLTLFSSSVGEDPQGNPIHYLDFVREFEGNEIRHYEAAVYGERFILSPGGIQGEGSGVLLIAEADVVVQDPVTAQQFNLGRTICEDICNISSIIFEGNTPYYSEQPSQQDPAFDPFYVTYLPEANLPIVDLVNHPILGPFGGPTYTFSDSQPISSVTSDFRLQPWTTILARTGEAEPQVFSRFAEFSKPALELDGTAYFETSSIPWNIELGDYANAFYSADAAEKRKILRSPDANQQGIGIWDLSNLEHNTNAAGLSAIIAEADDPDGFLASKAVYIHAYPNGLKEVVRRGESVTGLPATTFVDFSDPLINRQGVLAFRASFENEMHAFPQQAVFLSSAQSLERVLKEGDMLPGMASPVVNIGDYSLNHSSQMAFQVDTADSVTGAYLYHHGNITPIAIAGNNAPGAAVYKYIDSVKISNPGQVAFSSMVESEGAYWNGIYRLNTNGVVEEMFRSGRTQPGLEGEIEELRDFLINDQGQVIAIAEMAGMQSYDAIIMNNGFVKRNIVYSGQSSPDGNGTFDVAPMHDSAFENVAINDLGHLAFLAHLSGTTGGTSDSQGIFLYDGANLIQVARSGQSLDGSLVTSLDMLSSFDSADRALNNRMQLAYSALLADGREVIARFDPTLVWRESISGSWSSGSNWSLGVQPRQSYDVVIAAESAIVVDGPAGTTSVSSLRLGGAGSAEVTLVLHNDSVLNAIRGVVIEPQGTLVSSAVLQGEVHVAGNIIVGGLNTAETAMASIVGDLEFDVAATLQLEVGGTSGAPLFDQLSVSGDLLAGGSLEIASLPDFLPSLGMSFDVLDWGTLSGRFAAVQLPILNGLSWDTSQLYTSGVLSIGELRPGDFDYDGIVSGKDFIAWQQGNSPIPFSSLDLSAWKANYGTVYYLPAFAAVPEPQCLFLAGTICLLLCTRRQ